MFTQEKTKAASAASPCPSRGSGWGWYCHGQAKRGKTRTVRFGGVSDYHRNGENESQLQAGFWLRFAQGKLQARPQVATPKKKCLHSHF